MAVRKEYRVDGRDNYVIDCVPQSDGTIEMYPRLYPPDRHDRGAAHHHLMSDGRVCVSSSHKPQSMAEATTIAKAWAEGWSEYQRTGRFPGS